MEDNAIRALIIGVMLFVLIITITAISVYYTTSVKQAQLLNARTDYGTVYEKDIENLKGKIISGTESINIIRKCFEKYNILYPVIDREIFTISKNGNNVDSVKNIDDEVLLKFDVGSNYKIENVIIVESSNEIYIIFAKQ